LFFGHGKREENEGYNDQTAEKRSIHGVAIEDLLPDPGFWSLCCCQCQVQYQSKDGSQMMAYKNKPSAWIPGYLSNAPIDPKIIADNVPPAVFETKFVNAGQKPQFDHETVLQEIKKIDPNARRSIRSLPVLLAF
jgi:hypothetical protein